MSETQFNQIHDYYLDRIGEQEYRFPARELDVFNDVTLWSENPRLIPYLSPYHSQRIPNEDEMQATLRRTNGYDGLKKSIEDLGQLEPIYVKPSGGPKQLVLEGATRVTVLRDLYERYEGRPDQNRFRKIKVKMLPLQFSERETAILLARIHVRGPGVRNWGRYIQAKFIYEKVEGNPPMFSLTDIAGHMGKSTSWASRLRDAYTFAKQFVEFVDNVEAEKLALSHFSTLEEISKSTGFGVRVRANTPEGEQLREEVFDMVKHEVFKEYRDARHMAQYYDDSEKWEVLKSHERHAAHTIANQLRAGQTGINGKISGLHGQLERALDRNEEFDDDVVDELQRCADLLASRAIKVGAFRLRLSQFTRGLRSVSLEDIESISRDEFEDLEKGLEDFEHRLRRYSLWRESKWQS